MESDLCTTMTGESPLSGDVKVRINQATGAGKTVTQICSELSRSRTVINIYIRSPTTYGRRKPTGSPRPISVVSFWNIIGSMSINLKSVGKIVAKMTCKVGHQNIWLVLGREDVFKYRLLKKKICHTADHMVKRVLWAIDHIGRKSEWSKVIFSEEKKFNIDWTDGVKDYWHDHSQYRKCFVSRNFGRCSVMIWAAISANGKTYLVFVEKRWTQRATQLFWNISWSFLLLFACFIFGTGRNDFVLMQDKASVNGLYHSKEWLEEFYMDVLKWPALSSDINPTENVWGALSRAIERSGKQFTSVAGLKKTIEEKWACRSTPMVKNYIENMQDRCLSAIKSHGERLSY